MAVASVVASTCLALTSGKCREHAFQVTRRLMQGPMRAAARCLNNGITIFGVRSAAPSSSASSIGRPHRASGLALGLLDCQDDGNLALILIDRIAFSSSNFSVFTEVLSVVNQQGRPILW
jgi:hypothetical protein